MLTQTTCRAPWTLASMCEASWTATALQTAPQASSPLLCAAVIWTLRRGEWVGGLGWGGPQQNPNPPSPCLSPQALFREAGAVAGDAPHALGWPPATGPTAGAARQGLLGDLPARREWTARPPRSPRLRPACPAAPVPDSGESTLHQIPLYVVARCGTLSGAADTQTPPQRQALTCLLPCGPWPLPFLCPRPQSWPGCTDTITSPCLTSVLVGPPPHASPCMSWRTRVSCTPSHTRYPIPHPLPRLSYAHSTRLQLLRGWARGQIASDRGSSLYSQEPNRESGAHHPPRGCLGSVRY